MHTELQAKDQAFQVPACDVFFGLCLQWKRRTRKFCGQSEREVLKPLHIFMLAMQHE